MKNKFNDQLKGAFDGLAPKTIEMYSRWVCRLVRYHNCLSPDEMEQGHIDQWLAHLVRPMNYSRHSTNMAKLAVKRFFAHIGNPIAVDLVSSRYNQQIVTVLSTEQVERILARLEGRYEAVVRAVYNLEPEPDVLKQYAPMHRDTVNRKLKTAANLENILIPASLSAIRTAGIVHALECGEPWRDVMQRAGLKPSTMLKKYNRLAEK